MCHPANYNRQMEVKKEKTEVKKARKVVKKYRTMSYRKEMLRLRRLLGAGESAGEAAVLDQTVALITQLEARLLARLSQGQLPPSLQLLQPPASQPHWDQDTLRSVIGAMMEAKQ